MLMLAGATILLAGILIGRFLPARRRTPKPPRAPKPVCGCGHGRHDHHPKTNACHALVKRYRHNGSKEVLDRYEQCTCQRYEGPRPISTLYAPEIGD